MADSPLIAIVDDDESLLAALVRLVRSFGYEARGFESADAFVASDTVSSFSCVVTDIQMPGMSGIELAAWLSRRTPALPVIAITARAEKALEDSALANGAAAFLRKPIEGSRLLECIERAIGA